MKTINVVLADDHAIIREGLRRLIEDEPQIKVLTEAASGDALLECEALAQADVVLMDLVMPGPGPMETLRQLQRRHPHVRVLVLTMHKEANIAARMLRAGAAGFICKDNAYAMIGMALRTVSAGGRFIDPELVDGVLAISAGAPGGELHEKLSPREHEILQMLVDGKPLNTIADALNISPKTVSSHKARLMEKLAVDSNAELLRYALDHGLYARALEPADADRLPSDKPKR